MEGVQSVRALPQSAPAGQGPVWQDRTITVAGYVLLGLVQLCVAAMSWTGLVGFATATLHLHEGWQYMVPVSLDGASMAAAFLALRSVIRSDSAAGPRLMVAAFTAASAWFNYHHAQQAFHNTNAAVFFAGMSIGALAMFDLILRQLRRHALRNIGAIENPLARFRILRWLRYPGETFAAWSAALRNGYTAPADALAYVWKGEDARAEAQRVAALSDLGSMTKAEAARAALTATGGKVMPALDWLAERGLVIDRSYAYDVARQMRTERQLPEIAS